MFDGVEHIAIASASPPALAQWYIDYLAFRHIFEYDGNHFVKAANGVVLEIMPAKGPRAEQQMYDPGLRHMAITVKDLDSAYASLKNRGVTFLGDPYTASTGHRLVFFTDCEGNIIHLIQRVHPLPE